MYECASWTIKKAEHRGIDAFELCGVGEDSVSLLDCKEIQPVYPKGNQSWIFIGRTGAEAETPILWLPDAKNRLIGKGPDAGKDWKWEEKGTTEDETVGWHHWLNGHEFGQTPGVGDGQGSLACCCPWGRMGSQRVEHDWATELNWYDNSVLLLIPNPHSFLILPPSTPSPPDNHKSALCVSESVFVS